MSDSIPGEVEKAKKEKLRNEIMELQKKIKEKRELLHKDDCFKEELNPGGSGGEKWLKDTYHVSNHDVIPRKVTWSSSPLQGELGRREVELTRRERPESYPYSIDDDIVVGIEEDVEKLVQQLINPQSHNIIAIVGVAGSGKTTLARNIYNHEKIKRYFHGRAWVHISQVWSKETILRDIHCQVTGSYKNSWIEQWLIKEICTGDRSYLVVLDDVWEPNVLKDIIEPIAKSGGNKFVITTGKQEVFQFSNLVFSMQETRPLTDYQSLELFKKIVGDHQIMAHRGGEDLSNHMLIKCDGLPLAVILLARLLRTKGTIQEWMMVRNRVSSKIIKDHADPAHYGRVEDILGLSYSHLNYTLKSCFMYLSLFPENTEIRCGMLIRCWIAEGFFNRVWLTENETQEDVARQYLDKLIELGLVQIVRVNHVGIVQTIRVLHLARHFAVEKAASNFNSHTISSPSLPTSTMRCLRLGINYPADRELLKVLEDKVLRRLRTFIDMFADVWRKTQLKTIFSIYPLLRVLILDGFDTSIPDEIGSLIHLRYLRLSCVRHIKIPDSIGNLRNLVSFDCRSEYGGMRPQKLPNLKQMKQLRYLRLPWPSDEYEYLGLDNLPNLKVLWGIPAGKWMMTELKYLSPTIEKLWITDITSYEQLEEVYQCPSIVEDNLYALKLRTYLGVEFEVQKLKHCSRLDKLCLEGKIAMPLVFPPYLFKLELMWSMIDDQDSFADALQRLTYLKVLILLEHAYVGADLTFPANSLLNLETLQLNELYGLKRIDVMEGGMPYLKSFYAYRCYNLKVIPHSLKHLVREFDEDSSECKTVTARGQHYFVI